MPQCHAYVRACTQAVRDAQQGRLRAHFEAVLRPAGFTWGTVFADGPGCGAKGFTQRRGGLRCSVALEAGDVLLVPSLAVAFTSLADLRTMLDLWRGRRVELAVADLGIDSRTVAGRERLGLLAGIIEMQRAALAEQVREALVQKRRAGKLVGPAPIGYRHLGTAGRRRRVADEDERHLLRQLLEWRRAAFTITAIWAHLLKHRIRTRDGTEYSRTKIWRMCRVAQTLFAEEAAASSAPAEAGS